MTGSFAAITLIVTGAAAARGTWSPCGLSMTSAINPIAERGRGYRYWLTVLWFLAGSLLGGALLGGGAAIAAWSAGRLIPGLNPPGAALIGAIGCLIALAADLRVGGFSLPLHPRQVNEHWLTRYRRWLYASGFGFQIGAGFTTYIMTAATYLLVLLAVVSASPLLAIAAGLVFGLVRGSAVLLSSRCRSPQSLRTLHRWLSRLEPVSLRAVMLVEAIAASLLALLTTGWAGATVAAVAAGSLIVMALPGRLIPSRTNRARLDRSIPPQPGLATAPVQTQ